MGMQLIFDAGDEGELAEMLASHGVTCEMFPMSGGRVGISIPTSVVDAIAESSMPSPSRRWKVSLGHSRI